MITAAQLRAARAPPGIDQRELAQACGLSRPTIQRMEASEGVIRGNVDSLVKLVENERFFLPQMARGAWVGEGSC